MVIFFLRGLVFFLCILSWPNQCSSPPSHPYLPLLSSSNALPFAACLTERSICAPPIPLIKVSASDSFNNSFIIEWMNHWRAHMCLSSMSFPFLSQCFHLFRKKQPVPFINFFGKLIHQMLNCNGHIILDRRFDLKLIPVWKCIADWIIVSQAAYPNTTIAILQHTCWNIHQHNTTSLKWSKPKN